MCATGVSDMRLIWDVRPVRNSPGREWVQTSWVFFLLFAAT
jgi:hypothetical protein